MQEKQRTTNDKYEIRNIFTQIVQIVLNVNWYNNGCQFLKRLIVGLSIYQKYRKNKNENLLSLFLNKTYKINTFIDDIKHFKINHCQNNQHLQRIRNEIMSSSYFELEECNLENCGHSLRHFGRENTIYSYSANKNANGSSHGGGVEGVNKVGGIVGEIKKEHN